MTKPNLAAVRALVADAKPIEAVRRKDSPPPEFERDGVEAGKWKGTTAEDRLGLPKGSPVRPLGVSGNVGWFIDTIGQVQAFAPPYGKGHLLGLFGGDANFLSWAWPRWGKKGIDGYAAELAAGDLVHACFAKGPWDSVEKVRGRGCWLARDGESLVLHTGTKLHSSKDPNRSEPPGEIDGYVYPTRPGLPIPWPGEIEAEANPARLLKEMLRSWQWARPDVDPVLLLGWIGAAFLGGALSWRPAVYITGDKATGKSTLQALIKGLLGEYLIQAVDTTGAGIYQHIGNDSLPIAVDELEGESDTRKAKNVLKLARIAASGGLMLRGGDRHNPVEFRARSCFLFSSINTPPLEPQDLSRMAILRLNRLLPGGEAPDLSAGTLTVMGRCILRRLMDEWHRWPETLAAYRAELANAGMDGRGQDTFGALLAAADMIEHEGWDDERLSVATADGDVVPWSELMQVASMAEYEDANENWRLCLNHLLSVRVDAWRAGTQHTVGQLIEKLWNGDDVGHGLDLPQARRDLAQAGLGVVKRDNGPRDYWLAVPNQDPLTRTLFEGSKWAGELGASVGAGALRQSPRWRCPDDGAGIHDVAKSRIGGVMKSCTLISLAALYGEGGIMVEREGE